MSYYLWATVNVSYSSSCSVLDGPSHRVCIEIRMCLLLGRVDAAIDLLDDHFPSVLLQTAISNQEQSPPSSSECIRYVAPTSIDPAHLRLNLRILAFIEACRTIPLETKPSMSHPEAWVDRAVHHSDSEEDEKRQAELLSRAQKLHAAVKLLRKSKDQAVYEEELANVSGLLVYRVPEESPMSNYLSQERREAVADQIQSAILCRTGFPAISHMELYIRYTATLWSFLHGLQVKPPPEAKRPAGVRLPPAWRRLCIRPSGPDGDVRRLLVSKTGLTFPQILPPFDLQLFLESKP
jgi:hypothetical protein